MQKCISPKQMRLKVLITILKIASADGAEKALTSAGQLSDHLSKARAYSIYGRSNVDRWLRENLIQISDKRINRLKLEAIAAYSNRTTYLPVAER
jgi:hypothetical protein